MAAHQLEYVAGGNGAQANPRGTKVYCKNLHDGKGSYYRRSDILGAVRPEELPTWAKERLGQIQAEKQKKRSSRDVR